MENAGQCLAFGQPTASVFHLGRVAEYGLRKIVRGYELEPFVTWGSFLSGLREFANRENQKYRKKEVMALHARVQGIKEAWRDDTMHPNKSYNTRQAEEVFEAVRNFMALIAGNLP